ncbi:MAG: transcription antitermination factor NusB [Pleurocapsa sp. MO_192.B19]|nr:transcription antitermination factor NusB [Pleurocapsa sp. MO_192.B19]
MALRKQPRSIARELALLSISQIKAKKDKLTEEDLDNLILAAIRTLTIEVQDNLEAASAEIKRGEERLLNSETRASDLSSSRVMIQEALSVSQTAVNRLGVAIEFPEFLQLTSKEQVRKYAIKLIATVKDHRQEIEQSIENVLVAWQLNRLAKIDRDILRIAVAEIVYLDIPERVAINESVELAKRYSDEDGFRFINGVLRRLSDRLKEQEVGVEEEEEEEKEEEEIEEVEGVEEEKEEEEVEEVEKQKNKKPLPILKQTFREDK